MKHRGEGFFLVISQCQHERGILSLGGKGKKNEGGAEGGAKKNGLEKILC